MSRSDPRSEGEERFLCTRGARGCNVRRTVSSCSMIAMLIMTEVQLLTSHFNNDLGNDVLITISETGYSNDWISLRWLKHFDRFSQKHQKKA